MPARRSPPVRSTKPKPAARRRESAPAAETAHDGLQQAHAQPTSAPPQAILSLQHRFGNRAVQRLIQPKLKVGPAGDAYEREADHVADRVMAAPAAASAPLPPIRGRAAAGHRPGSTNQGLST